MSERKSTERRDGASDAQHMQASVRGQAFIRDITHRWAVVSCERFKLDMRPRTSIAHKLASTVFRSARQFLFGNGFGAEGRVLEPQTVHASKLRLTFGVILQWAWVAQALSYPHCSHTSKTIHLSQPQHRPVDKC